MLVVSLVAAQDNLDVVQTKLDSGIATHQLVDEVVKAATGNVGGTADPSALLNKHENNDVARQQPAQTIRNHERCTSAQFPDLEL